VGRFYRVCQIHKSPRKEHYNDDKAPPRGRIGRQADAIAKSHNLEALAYILDMARVEADQISKRWAGEKPPVAAGSD